MKTWFIALMLVIASSAQAWTTQEYAKLMRETISQMDEYYTKEVGSIQADMSMMDIDKRREVVALQRKWSTEREKAIRDMRQVHAEMKTFEDRQMNSSIRIRAKLQQTTNEIQHWRNAELARIQTLALSDGDKSRQRLQVNEMADARTRQVRISAGEQEDALRKLIARADKPVFTAKKDASSFALKHPR